MRKGKRNEGRVGYRDADHLFKIEKNHATSHPAENGLFSCVTGITAGPGESPPAGEKDFPPEFSSADSYNIT